MSVSLTKKDMTQMLLEYTQSQLDRAFDEEFEKAVERVKERRAEIVAGVAIKYLKYYKIETREDSLVITVEDRSNV